MLYHCNIKHCCNVIWEGESAPWYYECLNYVYLSFWGIVGSPWFMALSFEGKLTPCSAIWSHVMSLPWQAFPLARPADDDHGEKSHSRGAGCVPLHTSTDTWGVLFGHFGHILEKAKQTDSKTLQHLSTQIIRRLGVSVKVHLPAENSCPSPKKQNSAWFPQNHWGEAEVPGGQDTDITGNKNIISF